MTTQIVLNINSDDNGLQDIFEVLKTVNQYLYMIPDAEVVVKCGKESLIWAQRIEYIHYLDVEDCSMIVNGICYTISKSFDSFTDSDFDLVELYKMLLKK